MSVDRTLSGDITSVAGNKAFFCYECSRTVTITISPSSDPFCPLCNGGFIEEVENPNPHPNPNSLSNSPFPFSDPLSSFLPLLFSSSSAAHSSPAAHSATNAFDLQNPFAPPSSRSRAFYPQPDDFDPFAFLQNYLDNLRSDGAHVQFVIENHPSDPASRLPANIGDYFIGPGLEQLIQQLAENDPNRYGTPPASKSAIDSLPTIKITDHLLNSDMNQCAVCKDEFEKGTQVKQMPCKHVYHQDCLLPWLELHNSCPVCRYELPTDDPDYETRVRGAQSSEGSGGQGGQGENRTVERRFRISLPWPFGGHGSGSGSGTSDGGAGMETRQEDLD